MGQFDKLSDDDTVERAVVGDIPEYEWAGDARIRDIIAGLASDIPWDAKVGTLSGGQRRRVDLVRLLIGDWDILALDEPTNHLDVRAITWLANHLKNRWRAGQGALLVVTHDRWFLDEVCTRMWEVHDRVVEPFEGGFSAYILQRVERDRLAALAEEKRQNALRRELAWLARGPKARGTKPKFRVDAAHELIADVPPLRNELELKRMAMARLGKQVVELKNVTVRFDGKPGFRTPSGKIELDASLQAKHGFPGLPVYVEPPKPTAEYPFKLLNGTRRPYITHSKTRSDQPYLLELEPESTINMHPKDAEKLGIKEGDGVWLVSPYCDHKVRAKVRVTILCQPGLIDAQYGWRGDQETQPLIPRKNWDPISGYPCCNDVCIRVEKA